MNFRQIGGVMRLELKKTFLSRRGWWIYLLALVMVLAAEISVVARRHLWPRALLTPFTDDVQLTGADERTSSANQVLSAMALFRLNAKHLDIQFADGSRWEMRLR